MGRIALVALALAGLTGPIALATSPPHWTAKGKLTKLTHRTITVNGKSCRITPASPDRAALRIFVVGGVVKIECADGVLAEIDLLHPSTASGGAAGSSSSNQSTSGQSVSSSASSSSSSSSNGASSSATALAGSFPITAVGNGSITVSAPYVTSVTCKSGGGSPDLTGLKVGDVVTKMTCKDGILTGLTRR